MSPGRVENKKYLKPTPSKSNRQKTIVLQRVHMDIKPTIHGTNLCFRIRSNQHTWGSLVGGFNPFEK